MCVGADFNPLIAHPSRAHSDPQDLAYPVSMPVASCTKRESDTGHSNIAVAVYHVDECRRH